MIFGAVVLLAAVYVAYILWPRWQQGPVSLNAPSLPIVVSGVTFNVEPAAIRVGVQQRVDLSVAGATRSCGETDGRNTARSE